MSALSPSGPAPAIASATDPTTRTDRAARRRGGGSVAPAKGERGRERLVGVGLILLLAIIIVPLPAPILDCLIALNLGVGIVVLLTVLGTTQSLEFSTFPSVLLLTTLFRLALNIASTRLILLQADAGQIVEAFGQFVVGGDFFVGLVIFAIVSVVQFVVITKGAGRISEVSARFTLDAMPGKQMAIDADLGAGLIGEKEAKARRLTVMREAEFCGSMDGASKFVRGDAIAGLVILVVNILGGVVVGIRGDLSAMDAIVTYGTLTIGDGLAAQVPALIISVAAGILVTKSSSDSTLATDIEQELSGGADQFTIAAGVVLALGVVPGMPLLPFAALAGGLIGLGRIMPGRSTHPEGGGRGGGALAADPAADAAPRKPEDELGEVDRIALELGYRLVPLADPSAGGAALDRIRGLRQRFAREDGLLVPPIRVRDNLSLAPTEYRVLLGGVPVATACIEPNRYLAVSSGGQEALKDLEGTLTVDPAFGVPAKWIPDSARAEAEQRGFAVVDGTTALVTHLGEIVRTHMHEILTRDDVKALIEHARKQAPAVVEELGADLLQLGDLQKVLAALIREGVPVRNLPVLLEAVADNALKTKDPALLAELARQRLARGIIEAHVDESGRLHVITLDPEIEQHIADALRRAETGGPGALAAAIDPVFLQQVLTTIVSEHQAVTARGREACLLTGAELRRPLSEVLSRTGHRLTVVSFQEALHAKAVETEGVVRVPAGAAAA